MSSIFKTLKEDLFAIKSEIFSFMKNPINKIRHLPHWGWRRLIIAQIIVVLISSFLSSFFSPYSPFVWSHLVTMPLLLMISFFIFSLFFYYVFQIFARTTVHFVALFTNVFFSYIPFLIFQILSGYFPPMSLVGLAFMGLILIVGFVENFRISKSLAIRMILGLYIAFFLLWFLGRWNSGLRIE